MASARSLTGGTNDVNPQPLRCSVTTTATSSGTRYVAAQTVALPIPVQRLSTGGRAQVLEILYWTFDYKLSNSGAVTFGSPHIFITLSTRSNGTSVPALGVADPYSIDHVRQAVASGGIETQGNGARSCNDLAGHGILMGMDTLYVQGGFTSTDSGGATTNTLVTNVCIWYRWKNVGFSEYVGMVTSS